MAITLSGTTGITTPADTITGNATVGGTLTVNGVSNPLGVPGASGNVLTSNGTSWTSAAPSGGGLPAATAIGQIPFSTDGSTYTATQKIVQGTAQASTSGTSIDFTGIPSWVKRVTVSLTGVSTNGTSEVIFKLGISGGIQSTGYLSSSTVLATGVGTVNDTTGFRIYNAGGVDTDVRNGALTLALLNSSTNTWSATGMFGQSDTARVNIIGGSKTLSGSLDRIRITTVNGTDTFDAGSINILYE